MERWACTELIAQKEAFRCSGEIFKGARRPPSGIYIQDGGYGICFLQWVGRQEAMTKQGLSDCKVRLPLESRRGVERPSQEGLLEEAIGMYWEGVRENI